VAHRLNDSGEKMKTHLHRLVISLLLCGLAAGCAEAQFAPAQRGKSYPLKTPAQNIELFRTSAPTREFQEIGAVNACCSSDARALISLLRTKASESGGDALTDIQLTAQGGAYASVIRY